MAGSECSVVNSVSKIYHSAPSMLLEAERAITVRRNISHGKQHSNSAVSYIGFALHSAIDIALE